MHENSCGPNSENLSMEGTRKFSRRFGSGSLGPRERLRDDVLAGPASGREIEGEARPPIGWSWTKTRWAWWFE